MNKIFVFQEIAYKINFLKKQNKNIITNFYPNIEIVTNWINSGNFYLVQDAETLILLRYNKNFVNLYFVTTSYESLQNSLTHLNGEIENPLFVTGLVGKMSDISLTSDVFLRSGFREYATLCRMSRKVPDKDYFDPKSNVVSAQIKHANNILNLLYTYFDPLSEQLPDIAEIKRLIDNNSIGIYLLNNQILGFVIYIIKGYTSYLKFLFVHPEHRDKKIGSALLSNYYLNSKDAKLMILWVLLSNENAVEIYKHYGFQMDNFYNIVLTKNLINNGKENK